VLQSSSVVLKIADAGVLGIASTTKVVTARNVRVQEGSAGDLLAGIRFPTPSIARRNAEMQRCERHTSKTKTNAGTGRT